MRFRLRRPTVDTPFHIDWGWFERNNLSAASAVHSQVCDTHRAEVAPESDEVIDYIDPATGEVFTMDPLREMILSVCKFEEGYISAEMPVNQALFRLLLTTNNQPLAPTEMAEQLHRSDPDVLLRLLTSGNVSYGIVPQHV